MTPVYRKSKLPSENPPAPKVPRSKSMDDGMEGMRTGRHPKPTPTRTDLIIKRLPKKK